MATSEGADDPKQSLAPGNLGEPDLPKKFDVKPNSENVSSLESYLAAQLVAGAASRTSLEARATAIITTNTVLATLYIAVQAQFGVQAITMPGAAQTMLLFALIGSAVSIGFAVASIFPRRAFEVEGGPLKRLFLRGVDPDYELTRVELLEARIKQIDDLSRINNAKGRFVAFSLAALALASILVIAALSWSQLAR